MKYGCGGIMADGSNCENGHLCDVCQGELVERLERVEKAARDVNDVIYSFWHVEEMAAEEEYEVELSGKVCKALLHALDGEK